MATRRKKANPGNTGEELLVFALIAAAGYYVYTTFFSTTTATAATPTGGTTSGTASGTTATISTTGTTSTTPAGTTVTPIVKQSPASSAVTKSPGGVNLPAPFQTTAAATLADANFASGYSPTGSQLLVAASGGSSLDADQWLYYYNQLSGQSVPYESLTLPANWVRSEVIPVNAFVSYMPSSLGLSGYINLRGLMGVWG